MGSLFVKVLIIEYAIIGVAYAIERDWARVAYFVGAIVLSFGVLYMK